MAQRVAALMDAQGLTNEALAFKAGVATKTISRVLNARHESRAGTIEKIAKALGIEEWELRGSPVFAPSLSDGTTPDLSNGSAPIEQRLAAIEETLRRFEFEATTRDMAMRKQLEEGVRTILESLPGPQQ